MKKCPFCEKEISDAAVKCLCCGGMLKQPVLAAPASPPTAAPAQLRPMLERVLVGVGIFFALLLGIPLLLLITGVVKGTPANVPRPTAPAVSRQGPQLSGQTVPPAPAQDTAATERARVAVANMEILGLIKRMDLRTRSFYINGPLWEVFELDEKENIVRVISMYAKAEHGLPQVTLYESRSGKELASYGVFTGVTIR